MPDIIQDGDPSSAARFMQVLAQLQTQGQGVLDDLETARATTIFRFEQALSALNAKRQRAARVLAPDVACRFVVSDMLDLDQARTSATLRTDAQAATCRERSASVRAPVRRTSFRSATGTVEQFGDLYRVHVPDGGAPVGVLELEFYEAHSVALLVLDLLSMPSNPSIEVFGSADGVALVPARSVSLSGYRLNAWFAGQPLRYLQIRILPRMPDTLGGTTYTFGVTGVSAFASEYYLYSEVFSKTVQVAPVSPQVRFQAAEPALDYFLQFAGGAVSRVASGDILDLPGVAALSADTHIDVTWRLATGDPGSLTLYTLPADVYPSTVAVLDVVANRSMPVAYGLDPDLIGPSLVRQWLAVRPYADGGWLQLLPVNDPAYSDESGRDFRVSCVHGPESLTALLRVQLATSHKGQTPVFRGAWLEHVR